MYNDTDKDIMKITAQTKNKSRLKELIDFAKLSGYKRLGIANCICVDKYAQKLVTLLEAEGFHVEKINCRESCFDGGEICETMSGSCCDPLSQADFLNAKETELNIVLGLCVGHGLIFQKYSKAPCTVFLVKDLETKHNPLAHLS